MASILAPDRTRPFAQKPSAKRPWSLHDRLDDRNITELITAIVRAPSPSPSPLPPA
jgi:hypothetical protein